MSTACSSCGAATPRESWEQLDLVERLGFEQVSHLMTTWPWGQDVVIEVRRCACGAELARPRPSQRAV